METIKLRSYQIEAIKAIENAIGRGQKQMIVEFPTGFGKKIVLAKTIEKLNELQVGKILVLTSTITLKENIKSELFTNNRDTVFVDESKVFVETEHHILKNKIETKDEYQVIIFYNATMPENIWEILAFEKKTIIVFSTIHNEGAYSHFNRNDIIFSYTYEQAVADGYITPAMDTRAYGLAFELFSKQLLEIFGYRDVRNLYPSKQKEWDLVFQKENQKIWVECKNYKSQVVSPSAANSLLNDMVTRRMKQRISPEDIILLIVSSKIPSFQKSEIYDRFKIVVWDIENLVFYTKKNPILFKQLAQVTYFPIDYIEGSLCEESELAGLSVELIESEIGQEVAKEKDISVELLHRLKECEAGNEHSSEFEDICEEILRYLFEANYFNRLTRQSETEDGRFRMDLIGSLKISQNKEESIHPLWQMLVQHYNSHFVVFEFKNYSEQIDQNLIYITEKYLFNAALRNVVFIISREGFSSSAKFAAEGCLKENGKLIIDVTKKDLAKMLELQSDKAADYLLDKLEDFLMGISK